MHEDMAREGHIHPIIKRKGKDGGKVFGLKFYGVSDALKHHKIFSFHRLSCLQEEKDMLWCHCHQKNESSVSAAT